MNWKSIFVARRLYMILPSLRGFLSFLDNVSMPFEQYFFLHELKSIEINFLLPSARRDATMWRLYSILNPWRKPFPPCEISRRIYEPSMKELWADYVRCPTPIFRHTLQCDNWLERIVKSRFVNDVNDNIFSLVFTRFYRNWISVLLL